MNVSANFKKHCIVNNLDLLGYPGGVRQRDAGDHAVLWWINFRYLESVSVAFDPRTAHTFFDRDGWNVDSEDHAIKRVFAMDDCSLLKAWLPLVLGVHRVLGLARHRAVAARASFLH